MRAQLNLVQSEDPAKCRLCSGTLNASEEEDDLELQLCNSCKGRPEARRLGLALPPLAPRRPHVVAAAAFGARQFTPAEISLINRVHVHLPAQQLLDLLNERLVCDLGPDAAPYTMEQLNATIVILGGAVAADGGSGGGDWVSLRKLLATAKRTGVLKAITEQVINDFAIVYSLNPKQVLVLKDTLLGEEDTL